MAYPDDTARAVFQFTLPNGTAGYCTPHFKKTGGGSFSSTDVTDLANTLEDWATNDNYESATNYALMNLANDQQTLAQIIVTGMAVAVPPQATNSVNQAGVGTAAPMNNEASLVTTIYTGNVGRRYRGRNFWPVLSTTQLGDDGLLLTSPLTAFQTTFDALKNQLPLATGFEWCVNSDVGGFSTAVTSVLVRPVVHHQRRRNR